MVGYGSLGGKKNGRASRRPEMDVHGDVEDVSWGPIQHRDRISLKLAVLIGTVLFGAFGFGWNTGVLNNAKEPIQKCAAKPHHFEEVTGLSSCVEMSDAMFGVVVASFAIGGLIGGVMGGMLADRLGRRGAARLIACVYIVAGGLLFAAIGVRGLMIGRLVVGWACGASTTVVPLYLGEITPPSKRGAVGTLNQVVICVGIFVSQWGGLYLGTPWMWRVLLFLTAIPGVIQLILLFFQPESPRYLVVTGRTEQARSALHRLRGHADVETELADIADGIAATHGNKVSAMKLLFSPPLELKRPLIVACVLQLAQQLSGINVVYFYSTSIFQEAFHSASTARALSLFLAGMNVLATFVSTFLIDTRGRKPLLFVSALGMSGCSLFLVVVSIFGFVQMNAFLMLMYVVLFEVGLGPVPWLILAELFPTYAVGSAASIAVAVNWMSNFAVGVAFLPMAEALGDFAFLPFAILLVFFATFIATSVPETKGRTIEQIAAEFN